MSYVLIKKCFKNEIILELSTVHFCSRSYDISHFLKKRYCPFKCCAIELKSDICNVCFLDTIVVVKPTYICTFLAAIQSRKGHINKGEYIFSFIFLLGSVWHILVHLGLFQFVLVRVYLIVL